MAFDIYLKKERVFIDHHEESLFELIYEDEHFPKLNWIWENYYNGPRIEPGVANALVHELLALRKTIENQQDLKYLLIPIDRILPTLSKAYVTNQQIRCASD